MSNYCCKSHSRYTRAAFLTNIPVIALAHETPRSNYPCLKHLCGCFWNNVASKIFAQPVFWGVEIGSYFKHTATVWWSTPQSVSTGCSTLQNGSRWATSHTWLDIFPRRRTTRQIKSAPQFSTGANIKRDRGREREHASCSLPAHSCVFSMLCWGFESKYAKVREACGCWCELRGKLIEFPTSMLMWDMDRKFKILVSCLHVRTNNRITEGKKRCTKRKTWAE